MTSWDCCGGVEVDPLLRWTHEAQREDTPHSSASGGPCHSCPPPCSSLHVPFSLTARSCKVNTSGTKASPFQSACTHRRASVWWRTRAMCGTTTSSLSPTPNQVPMVLAWAQGKREEGRKEPALQDLGVPCCWKYLPLHCALSSCFRETEGLANALLPSRAAVVCLPCPLSLHSIECHQPRVVWRVFCSFLLRKVFM